MPVEEHVPIVGIYRFCWRCQRWRSIGNFSVSKSRGSRQVKAVVLGHACHLCWRKGRSHGGRAGFVLTDKARALLHPERLAAVS